MEGSEPGSFASLRPALPPTPPKEPQRPPIVVEEKVHRRIQDRGARPPSCLRGMVPSAEAESGMKASKRKLIDRLIDAHRRATTDAERAKVEQDARALGVTLEALLGRKR